MDEVLKRNLFGSEVITVNLSLDQQGFAKWLRDHLAATDKPTWGAVFIRDKKSHKGTATLGELMEHTTPGGRLILQVWRVIDLGDTVQQVGFTPALVFEVSPIVGGVKVVCRCFEEKAMGYFGRLVEIVGLHRFD